MRLEPDDTQPIPIIELPLSEQRRGCREGGCGCGECSEA